MIRWLDARVDTNPHESPVGGVGGVTAGEHCSGCGNSQVAKYIRDLLKAGNDRLIRDVFFIIKHKLTIFNFSAADTDKCHNTLTAAKKPNITSYGYLAAFYKKKEFV